MALHIEDFCGAADGSDTTPALNAAVQAAQAGNDREVHFQEGAYSFLTEPAVIPAGTHITGEGLGLTRLIREFSGGSFLTLHGNSSAVGDLTLFAAEGTSGGWGIHMEVSDTLGPGGNHQIRDVWITGHGTWGIPLFLNGINRTIAPIGLRTAHLYNVTVFNAENWACEFWNCVSCEWYGGGAYTGFGSTQAIAVGGALGQKNRIDADIDWNASTVWPGQMRGPGK